MLKRFSMCVVAASLAIPVLAGTASAGPMQIDAVAVDYSFSGIPHHLTPQKVQFNFTNDGNHDHMMAIIRKREGVKRSWQGLLQMKGNKAEELVVFYGETHANAGETAKPMKPMYLTQGRYLAICFFQNSNNSPPHYAEGMMRTFQVAK